MNKIATDAADQLRKYTTNFGTAWFLINIFFRIGLHQFVPKVYADDLKEFSCDTKLPGCENVCNNEFMPISLERFWGIELLCISSPTVIFMFYANFTESATQAGIRKKKDPELKRTQSQPANYRRQGTMRKFVSMGGKKEQLVYVGAIAGPGKTEKFVWSESLKRSYVIHLALRICLECLFVYLFWSICARLNGHTNYHTAEESEVVTLWNVWQVPYQYKCHHNEKRFQTVPKGPMSPCFQDNEVICWTARANEKTITIRYMLCIAICSMLTSLLELVVLCITWWCNDTKDQYDSQERVYNNILQEHPTEKDFAAAENL